MTYELRPTIVVKHATATVGDGMWPLLASKVDSGDVLCLECYPGVDLALLRQAIDINFQPELLINAESCALSPIQLDDKLKQTLTDDRVLGRMTHAQMVNFFDANLLSKAQARIRSTKGLVVVYGVGASIVAKQWDLLVYFNVTRWEIQQRYRKGLNNWQTAHEESDQLKKVKRGYFFEWRIADRQKIRLQTRIDYQVDTTNRPWTMVSQTTCEQLKSVAVHRPFRLVPYFDQSPWGGQWMKKLFHLPDDVPNYGWAFDGVPEENSVLFQLDNAQFELPAIDLVHERPKELLGERVFSRFGAEFPIRFDYLDTMRGGNLSLQVHPLVGYIQSEFGMHYTQDESYYIMATGENSTVYLGVRKGVTKKALFTALEQAQADPAVEFDVEHYVNRFPVKAHDHFSIPAGTIHCGGKNTVILEISATPYLFTFKLWDWKRVGLDGKPRPISLKRGAENVDTSIDTDYVKSNLFSPETLIKQDGEETVRQTGLCDREFIETRRHVFEKEIVLPSDSTVNMLNLVSGEKITLFALHDEFPSLTIHYGETFIIPAACSGVRATNQGKEPAQLLQAYVKK